MKFHAKPLINTENHSERRSHTKPKHGIVDQNIQKFTKVKIKKFLFKEILNFTQVKKN